MGPKEEWTQPQASGRGAARVAGGAPKVVAEVDRRLTLEVCCWSGGELRMRLPYLLVLLYLASCTPGAHAHTYTRSGRYGMEAARSRCALLPAPTRRAPRAPVEQFPVTPHTHTEGRICAGGRVSALGLAEVDNGYGISPNANHSTVVCAAVWRVVGGVSGGPPPPPRGAARECVKKNVYLCFHIS